MTTTRFLHVIALFASVIAADAFAQGMPGARMKNPGEQLVKFLGKNTAFTADAHVSIQNASGENVHEMEFAYAMLDTKVRTEMDMTKMRRAAMPPEAMAHLKQMGMDKTINVFIPEKQVMYLIYPGLQAYCEMPTPGAAAAAGGAKDAKEPKIEQTEIGKETIDGHPCVKWKVIVTDDSGNKANALLWRATDLKELLIQTQVTTDNGTLITTLFKNVNQNKPDAALFVPPAGFKRYGSMQELMMDKMQNMMPGAGTR